MFTVLKPGIYTTIQDAGRYHGAHLGIPVSGPMDRKSADIANLLLENDLNDALLECTYTGPSLQFHAPTVISFTGARVEIFKNDIPLGKPQVIQIISNDTISFGKFEQGCRLYIGFKGGIQSDQILKSRSTAFTAGIFAPIKKGETYSYHAFKTGISNQISIHRSLDNSKMDIIKGPEYDLINPSMLSQLLSSSFTILPSSNRMAYRISHNLDLMHDHSILSSGTLPGTVQLMPSGELVILMRDGQTTGGYPRILQLTDHSINDLAQLSPRQTVTFTLSS